MTQTQVLKVFRAEKALLTGHFLLSSGLHSEGYMQCALVLQKPAITQKLCRALAVKCRKLKVQVVVGPALGGVLVSYEVARALGVRSLFVERVEGVFKLRRGFAIKKNERVLITEDVVTTGKSTREVIEVVRQLGGKVVGVAGIVDRSAGAAGFEQPFLSLLPVDLKTYSPEACPLCRDGKIALIKPGSRVLIGK